MVAEPNNTEGDAKLAEKQRRAPKLGLAGMVSFIVGLRQRGRMSDGTDAGSAWLLLDPTELERLEDVADTLEYFRLQRVIYREKSNRFGGRQ